MTKKFKKGKKTFFALFGAVFLVVCLVMANFLAGMIIPASAVAGEVSSQREELHFLSLAKSQVKSEAETLAPDYRKIGAGGFVWEIDGYCYVVSSAYAIKNDALLVQSSIKQTQNLESEIISVKFDSISFSGDFSAEEKKSLGRALSAGFNFYLSIYDIAISLDTGVYNEISAKLAVNSAHNALAGVYADFSTIFPSVISSPLAEIDAMLENMTKVSQKLCTGEAISTGQTYSSLLKYRYMEVLKIYFEFLKEFE